MTGWLNENGGADRCAMTPSGLREMLNDPISIDFRDATLARALLRSGVLDTKPGRRRVCLVANTRRYHRTSPNWAKFGTRDLPPVAFFQTGYSFR
jgi:hypothetical protein